MPRVAENTIEELVARSLRHGWAVGSVDPATTHDDIEQLGAAISLKPVPIRRGDSAGATLTPSPKSSAPKASLSATVGMGQQPLHTDGAHLETVPDYLVLWCTTTSPTTTRIWNPKQDVWRYDCTGLFLLRSGTDARFVRAAEGRELRFDPGCMQPADGVARALAQYLLDPPPGEVSQVSWDTPGRIVVIRNREVLHGRSAVVAGDTARHLERMAFVKEAQ